MRPPQKYVEGCMFLIQMISCCRKFVYSIRTEKHVENPLAELYSREYYLNS